MLTRTLNGYSRCFPFPPLYRCYCVCLPLLSGPLVPLQEDIAFKQKQKEEAKKLKEAAASATKGKGKGKK